MAIQILVAKKDGTVIDELPTPELGGVAWRLNAIGRLRFGLARSSEKVTERNIRFGNMLLVRFDNGLPNWAGVIDTPRTWEQDVVEVSAYTIEHLFQYVVTRQVQRYPRTLVGDMFEDLVRDARQKLGVEIEVGKTWDGGFDFDQVYHFKPLWEIFRRDIIEREEVDMLFRPYLSNGVIRHEATLRKSNTIDKTESAALHEGSNIVTVQIEEQGPIVNRFYAVGSGPNWGVDRPVDVQENVQSKGKYGLREEARVFSGITWPAVLIDLAQRNIKQKAEPRTRILADVTDTSPGDFGSFGVGHLVKVTLPSYTFNGYQADCRVISREYAPSSGECSVVLEEYKDLEATPALVGGES